ncbi:hypothetical protein [Levilactobacillus brevis]|uniref:hypothetical protein n=1 Tax=Levilactobacillus brevis TaxID=1580 RepID=UPI0035A2EBC9
MTKYENLTQIELLEAYREKFDDFYPIYQSSGDDNENLRRALISGIPYNPQTPPDAVS